MVIRRPRLCRARLPSERLLDTQADPLLGVGVTLLILFKGSFRAGRTRSVSSTSGSGIQTFRRLPLQGISGVAIGAAFAATLLALPTGLPLLSTGKTWLVSAISRRYHSPGI